MAVHWQFQVNFGINETPLTIAIESRNYDLAEEIILSTSDVSYLNDGPYQNIPLHMVLTSNQNGCLKLNLKLAKLLVEKGANPNLRVFSLDFEKPAPSPFEELVVSHEILKYFMEGKSCALSDELEMYLTGEDILDKFVNNAVDVEGKWCMPEMQDCQRLVKQTSELIDTFLDKGGDPNVITTFGDKTLFHWIVEHDLELGKRFLKTSRVNINLCDSHGSSPLMDAILRNDPMDSSYLYDAMCESIEPIDVNIRNCTGETALFRASFVGAVQIAMKLCDDGAIIDSSTSAMNRIHVLYINKCQNCASQIQNQMFRLPSPILASLLSDAPARLRYAHVASNESNYSISPPHKHLIDKFVVSFIAPLIDHSYFTSQIMSENMSSVSLLLEHSNFNYLRDGRISLIDLTNLMFGQLSAGLRQLCVRKLFDQALMLSDIQKKYWPDIAFANNCIKDCKGALTESHMSKLVELLGLPQSFKLFFEIEAAKYQLCKIVMSLECQECQFNCSLAGNVHHEESETSYPSDLSSDYNGSILFSSDMLSEESSEEVDDLSDAEFSESEYDREGSEESKVSEQACGRSKIKCNYESSSSSSENIRVTVETLCEDVAENVAQEHHKMKCKRKYQRVSEDYTDSPTFSNCTSSSQKSISISKKETMSDSDSDLKALEKQSVTNCESDSEHQGRASLSNCEFETNYLKKR